jgi:endonuclease III
MSIFGVGEGIANMTLLLIEQAFGVQFPDLDRPKMDIKPYVHTKRVLFRLGVSKEQTELAAIQAARWLNPEFPGKTDGALWAIGRKWCKAKITECPKCAMDAVCAKMVY